MGYQAPGTVIQPHTVVLYFQLGSKVRVLRGLVQLSRKIE